MSRRGAEAQRVVFGSSYPSVTLAVLQAIDTAGDAILEHSRCEVEHLTELQPSQLEIGLNLLLVCRRHTLD
jgi:hypothetical protein